MIGAFWNVRGLNKTGRNTMVANFVRDNKLDFVGLICCFQLVHDS